MAQPETPALAQYSAQLACTTSSVLANDASTVTAKARIKESAESCVPTDFKAEMAGMSSSFVPATRAERVETLSKSVELRLSLCAQSNRRGAACQEMFARK